MNLISMAVAAVVCHALILLALPARGEVVTANFTSATTVPVTAANYTATGNTVNITLNFAPPVGTNLTVINNTGLAFIQGAFGNLTQGQVVNLTYGGITYPFVANYYGGSGNDLILVWANTHLLAWGTNGAGELGNGTTTGSSLPVAVDRSGMLAGKVVTAVSPSHAGYFNLALTADGSIAAWGDNGYDQLGNNGSGFISSVPVQVNQSGVLAGKVVIAVAAGRVHGLALCADGTLAAWGDDRDGQLGNNSTFPSNVPVLVNRSGVLAGKQVVAIAAGDAHNLVLCSDGTLAAWGLNSGGRLGDGTTTNSLVPVLVNQSGVLAGKQVIAIAPGGYHSFVLCSDGTLATWGDNSYGQLGNDSRTYSSVPVLVVQSGVLSGKTVVAIAAGHDCSFALCSDGTVAAWGRNELGELGNGNNTDSSVPVLTTLSGVLAGKTVTALSAGSNHGLARCTDGTLAGWGGNFDGQLGNGMTTNSSVPVLVSSSVMTAGEQPVALAAGGYHSVALIASPPPPTVSSLAASAIKNAGATLNGTVNAAGWATNVSFEYGLPNSYGATIAAVPASLTDTTATAVSAVLTDLMPGTVYHFRVVASNAFGTGKGQDMTFTTTSFNALNNLILSNGTLDPAFDKTRLDYLATVPFESGSIMVTPVAADGDPTVTVNGANVPAGTASNPLPLAVGENVVRIVVMAGEGGPSRTYTVTVTRLPSTFAFNSPADVPLAVTNFTGAGNNAGFALNFAPDPGTVLTVVDNAGGLIRSPFSNLAQGQVVNITYGGITYPFVANYYGGSGNDLVLAWANNRVFAWGTNALGQLGSNQVIGCNTPRSVPASGALTARTVIAVTTGISHTVAICADGSPVSWGSNGFGQLGNDSLLPFCDIPVAVNTTGVLAGKLIIAAGAGSQHTVVLCSDGTLAAWGYNYDGELGNGKSGSTLGTPLPVLVDQTGVLAGRRVRAIAVGRLHNLVLCTDGTLAAWGFNKYGQLGNNSETNRSLPVLVNQMGVLAGKTITAIVAGANHCLALCDDGTVAAWGSNDYGQLGNNSMSNSNVPLLVDRAGVLAGKTVTALAAGGAHSLALCSDGTVAAWGFNTSGQLGNGNTSNSPVPVLVDRTGVLAARTVAGLGAGESQSYARCADGSLVAWGANTNGQLGNDSTTNSSVPVPVDTTALTGSERFVSGSGGVSYGAALVASPSPPFATTLPASGIFDSTGTLNGTVNANNGNDVALSFDYGLTDSYGDSTVATPASVSGTNTVNASAKLNGLLAGTTYHYRLVATSNWGKVTGNDMTFTTTTSARLSGLTVSDGTLVPAFVLSNKKYAVTVPFATTSLTMTPVCELPASSVTINNVIVASGAASNPLALSVGNNPVQVVVTAGDGLSMETYIITVTRLPQVFTFNSATDVQVTADDFLAAGIQAAFALNFAPLPGTVLTVVRNTGPNPIRGAFGNLAQGQFVNLTYDGINYGFVANYCGGTGNDLVLQWANTRLLAWGYNEYGQLGNNSTIKSGTAVAVDMSGVLAGKTIASIAAGSSHNLVRCVDGTLAAWGANGYGQLGNGSNGTSSAPVLVNQSGVLAGKSIVAIAAAYYHSLVLCSDGTLVSWGQNSYGALGNGGGGSSNVPVAVDQKGVLSGKTVVAISATGRSSYALCSDGTVAAWGYNSSGQLGNNKTTNSNTPVLVEQTNMLYGRTVVGLGAGYLFCMAACTDGTLAVWGSNTNGQLGNNSTTSSRVPVMVDRTGVLADKTMTSSIAGSGHCLTLCADGTLASWGYNNGGQLGDGSTTNRTAPVLVNQSGVLNGQTISAISAGGNHSLVVCSSGSIAAWGGNNYGQLGNNSMEYSTTPVLVDTGALVPGARCVAAVAGESHSLALVASPPPPMATTLAATVIANSTAILNGRVNAAGADTAVSFEYGMTTAYGTTVAAVPAVVSGTETTAVSKAIDGLIAGTTYHYRVVAANPNGTTRGADITFTTTSDNPEGDNYDSLIEYAFNLPSNNGTGSPFSIKPSTSPTGKVELGFIRPVGATTSVTYYLEYSRALGAAVSWIPIPLTTISPRNIDIAAIDDLTERVTIRNFEAHEGFVRFRVELDSNGDRITDHISCTGVQGWTESAMELGTRTYNNPYQNGAVFTGTVDADGVSGQTLRFATSAGAADLGTVLPPGASYYLEVTAGTNEGQRFDVVSASGNAVTLAADSDVCSDIPPFNTLAGVLPAALAGNRIAIHRHWTLGELFPVGRFLAAGNDATADQVQTSAVAVGNTYWLLSNNGSPKWVRLGDATLADQGSTVLAPGRGLMVTKRGAAARIMSFGEVRSNKFIRPLCAGPNLVGGGWPIAQSAAGTCGRQMDVAHGFTGSTDPAVADTFSVWHGDSAPGATGYDNYYLYNPGSAPKWVKTGDVALVSVDAEPLFLGDHGVLIQMKNNLYGYTMPNPLGATSLNAATLGANSMQGLADTGAIPRTASDLISYAFGLNPGSNNPGSLPQGKLVGDHYVIEFTEPTGVTGITYGAEVSATLLPNSWTEVPDTGAGSVHIFSVPLAGGKLFMRLKVTGQ